MGKLAEHPRTGGRANLGGFEVQTHAQARLCPRPAVRAGHSPRALGGKGGGALFAALYSSRMPKAAPELSAPGTRPKDWEKTTEQGLGAEKDERQGRGASSPGAGKMVER